MSSTYTPNPANNPASITLPSDGDAMNAASVNTPLEGIFDAVAFTQAALATEATNRTTADTAEATARAAADTAEATARAAGDAATLASAQAYALLHNARLTSAAYTASDTTGAIVVPARVTAMIVEGYGGGGGGGGGAGGSTSTDNFAGGGAGGAGALLGRQTVAVTPGQTLDVTIGAGGASGTGGAAGTQGGDGGDGGDSIVAVHGGAELCRFAGGQGGRKGQIIATPGSTYSFFVPGAPVTGGFRPTRVQSTDPDFVVGHGPSVGGAGGLAQSGVSGRPGWRSPQGYAGGAAGTKGTDSGSYRGGGASGGGGGGAGGVGTDGGASGNGGGTGTVTGPLPAGANTGAGGGGGGAGGADATTPSAGAAGGNGGSGKLTLIWVYDT